MSALRALPAILPDTNAAALSAADLLQHQDIWRAREGSQKPLPTQPTGCTPLDAQLPGHGLPLGLCEVLLLQPGMGEMELLLPLLARRTQAGQMLVYVHPPCPPCVQALAQAGVALDRVLWIAPASERDALWAAEQILASGIPGSVLLWSEQADERLPQMASDQGMLRVELYVDGRPMRTLGAAMVEPLGNTADGWFRVVHRDASLREVGKRLDPNRL